MFRNVRICIHVWQWRRRFRRYTYTSSSMCISAPHDQDTAMTMSDLDLNESHCMSHQTAHTHKHRSTKSHCDVECRLWKPQLFTCASEIADTNINHFVVVMVCVCVICIACGDGETRPSSPVKISIKKKSVQNVPDARARVSWTAKRRRRRCTASATESIEKMTTRTQRSLLQRIQVEDETEKWKLEHWFKQTHSYLHMSARGGRRNGETKKYSKTKNKIKLDLVDDGVACLLVIFKDILQFQFQHDRAHQSSPSYKCWHGTMLCHCVGSKIGRRSSTHRRQKLRKRIDRSVDRITRRRNRKRKIWFADIHSNDFTMAARTKLCTTWQRQWLDARSPPHEKNQFKSNEE